MPSIASPRRVVPFLAWLLALVALASVTASSADAGMRAKVHAGRSLDTRTCAKAHSSSRTARPSNRVASSSGRVARKVTGVRAARRQRCSRTADSGTSSSLYWGSWIGKQWTGEEAPWDMNAVSRFEATVEKPLSLVQFSAPFANCSSSKCSYYQLPTEAMENIRQRGAIPFFSWASSALPASSSQPDFQLSKVIAGNFDPYIREVAESAQAWAHPFFLRFNWEMNGNWFPWSEGVNGNNAGEYVAAWRHVHDIFTSVGATNATWVWCPNVDPGHRFLDLASLYPGDEYVDWTCLDGYNWGNNPVSPRGWVTFDQLFKSTYEQITGTIAPSKPMVIAEVGSSEVGGSKKQWIEEMLEDLPTEYPRVNGVMWFDKWVEEMDWPLDSSSDATAGFAEGIRDPAYLANSFGSLPNGPVPTPD